MSHIANLIIRIECVNREIAGLEESVDHLWCSGKPDQARRCESTLAIAKSERAMCFARLNDLKYGPAPIDH